MKKFYVYSRILKAYWTGHGSLFGARLVAKKMSLHEATRIKNVFTRECRNPYEYIVEKE